MTNKTIQTKNPSTGTSLHSYEIYSAEAVTERLGQAVKDQARWRETTMAERCKILLRVSEILLREKSQLALLMEQEMGKKREEGLAEIEKCASCARFYAENGPGFLAPIDIKTEASKSFVSFSPLGVVLAVMPWNFPHWQVFRCALPAILAGNAVVLKHASNVMGSALAAEKIWQEAAGIHGALFQTLVIPGAQALALLSRPEIAAVSFTGSTDVGKQIAAAAGANLKKCVLELGGSDAYVVLAEADLDLAARVCAQSRLSNAGQSCISAKRFIVDAKVRAQFEEKFVAEISKAKLAPLAREDLRHDLHSQVERTKALGARALCGGAIPEGAGFYYPATVLTGVKPGMPAFDEELFGPVAAVIEARDEEHALQLANQSIYGLGAAVFTKNREHGLRIARDRLEAGSCFVNELVRSDPRLPFGGIKESGFGRELSEFGIREFVNIKTVYVG